MRGRAGVENEDGRPQVGNETIHQRGIGGVARHHGRAALRDAGEAAAIARDHGDVGALSQQGFGDAKAQAPAAAGDQHALVFDAVHDVLVRPGFLASRRTGGTERIGGGKISWPRHLRDRRIAGSSCGMTRCMTRVRGNPVRE